MDFQGVASLILAFVAVAGAVTSYLLSKRGQKKDELHQEAANRLAERIQTLEEMKTIIGHLREEVSDLRNEIDRIEALGERRLTTQKERCRSRLDALSATLTALNGVVLSEVARASTVEAVEGAQQHVDNDHREP